MNDIITIRDKDWEKLALYFSIPENIKNIDFTKIELNKQEKLVRHKKNRPLPLFEQSKINIS